jgi:hypothetical protein
MTTFPESVAQSGMRDAFDAAPGDSGAVCPSDAESRRWRAGPWLFAIWVLASLAWTGMVVANVYYRASAQADMSHEVELELDSVSCTGPDCSSPVHSGPQEQWADIAETYVQFGYVSILEWAILPPAALLMTGVAGALLLRRRRTATRI